MIKIIVPVSGGKDSQACLKMAISEHGSEHVMGLFCDTKFEHPINYKHIKTISKLYNVYIHTVSGGSVEDKVRKYKRFPGGGARHCTDELKIRETRLFLKSLGYQNRIVQIWYGMRHDESDARAKRYEYKDPDELYPAHEVIKNKYPKYLEKMGFMFRLPIIDWVDDEVFDYIKGEENPLYKQGFKRVGCFPCLASGDKWKIKAFEHDEFGASQKIKVKQLEEEIGKSVFTSGIGQRYDDDNQGCVVCSI